jgi:hypothetical protein
VVAERALRIGALSAAPPVRRPASAQAYGCKALDNAVRLISKLICANCSPPRRIHCIAKAFCDQQKSRWRIISSGRGFVFDVQLVRTLCQELLERKTLQESSNSCTCYKLSFKTIKKRFG